MTIQELVKLTKHDTIKVYNDLSESEIFKIWETTGIPRHKIADELLCVYSNRPDLNLIVPILCAIEKIRK